MYGITPLKEMKIDLFFAIMDFVIGKMTLGGNNGHKYNRVGLDLA